MRLLVTGSRNWTDTMFLEAALERVAESLIHARPEEYIRDGLVVVSGHCRQGADRLAEEWAKSVFAHEPETHPADWRQGKRAGFARNKYMVDLGADRCVAFIMRCIKPTCPKRGIHGSHGATHCADYAESQGIPTDRYTEEDL